MKAVQTEVVGHLKGLGVGSDLSRKLLVGFGSYTCLLSAVMVCTLPYWFTCSLKYPLSVSVISS